MQVYHLIFFFLPARQNIINNWNRIYFWTGHPHKMLIIQHPRSPGKRFSAFLNRIQNSNDSDTQTEATTSKDGKHVYKEYWLEFMPNKVQRTNLIQLSVLKQNQYISCYLDLYIFTRSFDNIAFHRRVELNN